MDKIKTVDDLIAMFGGLTVMARELGHNNPTTIQGWKISGSVPIWRHPEILGAAERLGLAVSKKGLNKLVRVRIAPEGEVAA